MNMRINDVKDWSSLVAKVATKTQQKGNKTPEVKTPGVKAPNPQMAHIAALPERAAPQTNQSAQVKEGVETLTGTKLKFSIEVLIALLFELALKERQARRESSMADATAAEQMGMAAAKEVKSQAVMEITGAVFSATAQVTGAATVVGGGIRTVKSGNFMEVSNKMMTYQATSQAFGSGGQLTKGGFDYQAKQDEAQKAMDDASATQAKSIEESDNQDQKDEAQLVQSIIQLQQQQEESRHEAMRATA